MKHYFVIFRGPSTNWSSKSEEEWMALGQKRSKWIESLGDFVSAKIDPKPSKVVTLQNGQLEVKTIPHNEKTDFMNGFFLIQAENVEHAIELMSGCPWLMHDKMEIFEAEL